MFRIEQMCPYCFLRHCFGGLRGLKHLLPVGFVLNVLPPVANSLCRLKHTHHGSIHTPTEFHTFLRKNKPFV